MVINVGDLVTKDGWKKWFEVVSINYELDRLWLRYTKKYTDEEDLAIYHIDTGRGLQWIAKESKSKTPLTDKFEEEGW